MNSENGSMDRQAALASDAETITVLIADDHKMISEALKALLSPDEGFDVYLAASLSETLDALRHKSVSFDLILLDVSMPGMQGLRSVKHVIDTARDASVVVFSGTTEPDFVWQAIELGAKGYISKDQPLRSLPATLRLIADGHEFVPITLSRQRPGETDEPGGLTSRDRLILKSVSEGKTNKEIAVELGLTELAIKMKMRGLYSRLNARNRAHAVIIATQQGII